METEMNPPYATDEADASIASEFDADLPDNDSLAEDDDTDTPPSAKRSKPSTPLQATLHLLEISSRIDNFASELKHVTSVLSGDKSNESEKNALFKLRKSLMPFLSLISQGIIDSTLLLTPIEDAVAQASHIERDNKWKRKVLREKEKSKRNNLHMIDAYVSSCYLNDEEFWHKKKESKKRKAKEKESSEQGNKANQTNLNQSIQAAAEQVPSPPNKPLVRIAAPDGTINYPPKPNSKIRCRQKSCYICRQYTPATINTQWKCRDCEMPLCQVDRTNGVDRYYSCLAEHKMSTNEYLGCGLMVGRRGFVLPNSLRKYEEEESEKEGVGESKIL